MIFDPTTILAVLAEHEVDYVLIGGMAAALHGADHVTTDIDITPEPSSANLGRLLAALTDLDARIRVSEGPPDGLPFAHDAASLAAGEVWNLVTRAGDLDVVLVPSGTSGYRDVVGGALLVEIHSVPIRLASLEDVISSKEAADRPKDRAVLPLLRRLHDELGGIER